MKSSIQEINATQGIILGITYIYTNFLTTRIHVLRSNTSTATISTENQNTGDFEMEETETLNDSFENASTFNTSRSFVDNYLDDPFLKFLI